jgi:hypothetical protein
MDPQDIIAATCYMTLATAGEDGRPWSSPVFYAPGEPGEFLWISRPGTRHSQNIAARPEIALTIFDSHQKIGTGNGLYVAARAEQTDGERLASFNDGVLRWGGSPFTLDSLGERRLYRAVAEQAWVLDDRDRRVPVTL